MKKVLWILLAVFLIVAQACGKTENTEPSEKPSAPESSSESERESSSESETEPSSESESSSESETEPSSKPEACEHVYEKGICKKCGEPDPNYLPQLPEGGYLLPEDEL